MLSQMVTGVDMYGLDAGFLEEDGSDSVEEDFRVLFRRMLAVYQLCDPFVGAVGRRCRRRCCLSSSA